MQVVYLLTCYNCATISNHEVLIRKHPHLAFVFLNMPSKNAK